jgi:biopolymer transport protein ExbD
MAFGRVERQSGNAPIGDINMVPLIDVMLVLLVIFIVTAPLLTHAVKIDLPRASSAVNETKPDKIEFAIDADGALFWNGERIDRSAAAQRFAQEGARNPQPELHLRADRNVRYEAVADVMSAAAKAGLRKIGFVSDPRAAEVRP